MIAKKIDELLGDALKGITPQNRSARDRREEEFFAVTGEEWTTRLKVLSYERGTMTVGTNSSAVLQEVAQFHRANWFEKMIAAGSPVKKIAIILIDESEMTP